MKNEFILHFSAIPIARLVPPPEKGGPVTGSLRDLYTLEWGGGAPRHPRRGGQAESPGEAGRGGGPLPPGGV